MKPLQTLASSILFISLVTATETPVNVNVVSAGAPAVNARTDPNVIPLSKANKQHSIKTECHATRAIYDHEGSVAKWLAHCHVEIWAGKEQPVFDDLNPEKILKNGIKSDAEIPEEYKAPPPPPKRSLRELLQQIQFLVDEARLSHHECMESKQAIMGQLRTQLPPTVKSEKEVLAAINNIDVHLPPNAGLYLGHMDDFMKQKVAELHAIYTDPSLDEAQRKEAIKAKNMEINSHLDTHCQSSDPRAAHYGVTTQPPADLEKMKVALLLRQPGNRVEILHLPESAYAQYPDMVKSMAEAALHHSATTGQIGDFGVSRSAFWTPKEELSWRGLTGHDYSPIYHHIVVPHAVIVTPKGNNIVAEGVKVPSVGVDDAKAATPASFLTATVPESATKAESVLPVADAQVVTGSVVNASAPETTVSVDANSVPVSSNAASTPSAPSVAPVDASAAPVAPVKTKAELDAQKKAELKAISVKFEEDKAALRTKHGVSQLSFSKPQSYLAERTMLENEQKASIAAVTAKYAK